MSLLRPGIIKQHKTQTYFALKDNGLVGMGVVVLKIIGLENAVGLPYTLLSG